MPQIIFTNLQFTARYAPTSRVYASARFCYIYRPQTSESKQRPCIDQPGCCWCQDTISCRLYCFIFCRLCCSPLPPLCCLRFCPHRSIIISSCCCCSLADEDNHAWMRGWSAHRFGFQLSIAQRLPDVVVVGACY